MVEFKRPETDHQLVLQRFKAVEVPIMEVFFPPLIPDGLLGVEFGGMGWQEQQAQVVRSP